jgi:spore coat protein A, manganese oxidase
MSINRREFIRRSMVAGVGTALLPRIAWSFCQSPAGIRKFLVSLPALGPGGANNIGNYLTVLSPNTTRYPGTDYYEIVAKQFSQQLHPDIPSSTFWGYADAKTLDSKYLGGAIVAQRNRPVKLKLTNNLPAQHILPVDPTLIDPAMFAEVGGRQDRVAIHLHGGLIHWQFDGGPFHWFSNALNPGGFAHGSSFMNGAGPGAAIYDYPNNQSARFLWYHDHAYGLTRTNAYGGLATAYLITDDAEAELIRKGILPTLGGAFPLGIPLVIQDKTFWDGGPSDPNYNLVVPAGATPGSLWYPHIYEGADAAHLPSMWFNDPGLSNSGTARWEVNGGTPPPVSTVPEFFCDTILVNGAPYPVLPVGRQRYRFRLLNGSQARFFNLQMYLGDTSPDGITLAPSLTEVDPNGNPLQIPTNPPGPRMIQIGNETGFLLEPVVLNNPPLPAGYKLVSSLGATDPTLGNVNRYTLLLAPAERADIIVDFRDVPAGSEVILYNDAPAPFPGGDIRTDYYTGRPDLSCIAGAQPNAPGAGPDTRIIMKFKVGSATVSELSFDRTLSALRIALPITFALTQPSLLIFPNSPARIKTLNEDFDTYGRLRQILGAPVPTEYLATPTEVAHKGEVQRWVIYNFTGDTHPMHFHLVNVAIRKREQWAFDANTGAPLLNAHGMPYAIPGTARGPDMNELGWKETVRMSPGEVITVDMKFDLPSGTAPFSPRLQASYGVNGYEYVWHCHILEHEEHDMMHALVVV